MLSNFVLAASKNCLLRLWRGWYDYESANSSLKGKIVQMEVMIFWVKTTQGGFLRCWKRKGDAGMERTEAAEDGGYSGGRLPGRSTKEKGREGEVDEGKEERRIKSQIITVQPEMFAELFTRHEKSNSNHVNTWKKRSDSELSKKKWRKNSSERVFFFFETCWAKSSGGFGGPETFFKKKTSFPSSRFISIFVNFLLISLLFSPFSSLLFHLLLFHLLLSSCLVSSCLVLSCLVLSCLVLSCLVLSCLVLSCLVLSCLVLSCLVLSCLVLSCLVLSCLVLSCLVLSCLVLSCLVLSCLVLSGVRTLCVSLCLFVSLCVSLCLSVSLCVSLCLSVSLCVRVMWCCGVLLVYCVCWCVFVCECVAARWKNVEKPVCGFKNAPCVHSERLREHMCAWCRHTRGRFESAHGGVFESTCWEQGVIVSSAYQNLPTYCYHVLQRFTKETFGSFLISSLRIDWEQHVPSSSDHSLSLIKLFSFSCPGETSC